MRTVIILVLSLILLYAEEYGAKGLYLDVLNNLESNNNRFMSQKSFFSEAKRTTSEFVTSLLGSALRFGVSCHGVRCICGFTRGECAETLTEESPRAGNTAYR